jgi:hypothetical protein
MMKTLTVLVLLSSTSTAFAQVVRREIRCHTFGSSMHCTDEEHTSDPNDPDRFALADPMQNPAYLAKLAEEKAKQAEAAAARRLVKEQEKAERLALEEKENASRVKIATAQDALQGALYAAAALAQGKAAAAYGWKITHCDDPEVTSDSCPILKHRMQDTGLQKVESTKAAFAAVLAECFLPVVNSLKVW